MRMRNSAASAAVLSTAGLGVACVLTAGCTPTTVPAPATSSTPTAVSAAPTPTVSSAASIDSDSGTGSGSVTGTDSSANPGSGTSAAPVDVRRVDWASATLRMPALRDDDDCPVGSVSLTGGRWAESGEQGPGSITSSHTGGPPTYGDLDGDGRAEAVVHVACWAAGGDSGDSSGQLLVVNGRTGALVGMGYVGPLAQDYGRLRISDGRLTVTITQRYSDVRQQRTYEWNGRRFVQVAGPAKFPSPPA